jgi:ketosteroid isomerase-like protein
VFRLRGEGSDQQAPFEYTFGLLCRVAAGQIHYIQTYLEADQALEAVGLRE